MKIRSASPAILFLPLLLTSGLQAQQGARPDVSAFLPADCYASLRFGGLGSCKEQGSQLGLKELFDQVMTPELRKALFAEMDENPLEVREEFRRKLKGETGIEPSDLKALLSGPIALGIGRPTFFGPGMTPSFLVATDIAGRENAVKRVVEGLLKTAKRHGADLTVANAKIGKLDARVLHLPEQMGSIYLLSRSGFLLVSNGKGILADAVKTIRGDKKAVPSRATITRRRQLLPQAPHIEAELNLSAFQQTIEPWLPYEAAGIGKALGIEGIEGLGYASSRSGTGTCDVFSIDVPGSSRGLFKTAFRNGVRHDAARMLPARTPLYWSMSVDLPSVLDAAMALHAQLPERIQHEMGRNLHRTLRRGFGHGPQLQQIRQVLGLFGSEISIAVTQPAKNQLFPDAFVFVDVKNPQAVQEMMEKLLSQKGMPKLRRRMAGEHELRYMSLRKMQVPFVIPAYTFVGNKLVFCTRINTLQGWLKKLPELQDSLANESEFQGEARGSKGASSFFFLRLGKVAKFAIPLIKGQAEVELENELGIEMPELPSGEDFDRALGNIVSTMTVDENGVRFREKSPISLGGMVLLAGSIADWFLSSKKIY